MEVPDRLASIFIRVDDDAIARICESLVSGDLCGQAQQLAELPNVIGVVQRVYVLPRNHQKMRGSLGTDVTENNSIVALRDYVGGYVAVDDPAEKTFLGHYELTDS